jgi:hypothetical protein
MNVNGLKFITTISKHLHYRTAQYIMNKSSEEYAKVLNKIMHIYRKAGFLVTHIYCDNEFRPLMTHLLEQEPNLFFNFANPNEHVPEIERSIRVIKERVRATYHRLPFHHLPRTIVKLLVSESTKKLNFFPVKGGIYPYYSPRMILHQRNLDYEKHCKHAFGSYVQAHDDPKSKNTNASRTLDCIYLRYTDNIQGVHELLHLQTNEIVYRQYITLVPITSSVIKQVHELAVMQKMPHGLKVKKGLLTSYMPIHGFQEWKKMKTSKMEMVTKSRKLVFMMRWNRMR